MANVESFWKQFGAKIFYVVRKFAFLLVRDK